MLLVFVFGLGLLLLYIATCVMLLFGERESGEESIPLSRLSGGEKFGEDRVE